MLTPEERRGAVLILVLVLLGGAWDGWLAFHPSTAPAIPETPSVRAAAVEAAVAGAPPAAPGAPVPGPAGGEALVDVNRAGAPELDRLPGIGPVLARRIVEHRERNGPFRSIEELRAVRGIGPSLIARLEGRVRFGR